MTHSLTVAPINDSTRTLAYRHLYCGVSKIKGAVTCACVRTYTCLEQMVRLSCHLHTYILYTQNCFVRGAEFTVLLSVIAKSATARHFNLWTDPRPQEDTFKNGFEHAQQKASNCVASQSKTA